MKNILIVGSSKGIGLEMVKILSKDNHVIAISRHTDNLKSLINESNLTVWTLDISQENIKAQLINQFELFNKKIDIVINNAGYLVNKPLLEQTRQDIENQFLTNTIGIIQVCQAVIPFMNANGHIVNIGSMGGFQGSSKFTGLSAYSASKAAIASFTECLAEELKDLNIQANCLALGAVQTEMLAEAFPGYEAPVSANKMAEFITDFSLNANQWVNGKVIPVSLSTP